ncbi:MAG TPA: CDP-alcohol phosphatidyltransferase family protein [Stellaceae bacterium]|nr:CDP-alcohol phosphatidyltransferase family protein [Stellaceae bacterium]
MNTGERVAGPDNRLRRHNEGILQFLERPALRWLSAAMPEWVTPDMLTALGLFGSVIAAVSYALAPYQPWTLWACSAGIAINWFGDSLDGNVARARGIERPAYGFFLDNATDVLEYVIFAIGMGLSGYIRWELVLGNLAAFYMMMLLGLIKSRAMNIFQISFGGMGLTEIRVAFVLINALLFFVPPFPFSIAGVVTTYPNVLSALWVVVQFTTFLVVTVKTLGVLRVQEPPRRRR